jgi:hypothetical protein
VSHHATYVTQAEEDMLRATATATTKGTGGGQAAGGGNGMGIGGPGAGSGDHMQLMGALDDLEHMVSIWVSHIIRQLKGLTKGACWSISC